MTKQITQDDYVKLSKEYGVEYAAIKAFVATESGGKGFYDDGDPVILFEGHWFYKLIPKAIRDQTAKNYPNLCYPKATSAFYSFSSVKRLATAMKINKHAALMSCSWGLMQVMGFNYSMVGYDSIEGFVAKMCESEYWHVKAGLEYLRAAKLIAPLQAKDWKTVAYRYNGAGYAKNQYDLKMEMHYKDAHVEQEQLIKEGKL